MKFGEKRLQGIWAGPFRLAAMPPSALFHQRPMGGGFNGSNRLRAAMRRRNVLGSSPFRTLFCAGRGRRLKADFGFSDGVALPDNEPD